MRRTAAATRIQTSFRGFQQRKRFHVIQKAVVGLQALARGKAARHRHMAEVRHQKAIVIQKHVRGWLARKKHARILQQIVYLQSCWRRWKARKELKALKVFDLLKMKFSEYCVPIFFVLTLIFFICRYKRAMLTISSRSTKAWKTRFSSCNIN